MINVMVFAIIVLITWLSYILTFSNLTGESDIKLFEDNGKRISLQVVSSLPDSIDQDIRDCELVPLKKCRTDNHNLDCFSCKEKLTKCHNFTEMSEVQLMSGVTMQIEPNADSSEGYCLYILGKENRKCTLKKGGRWVLTEYEPGKYSYLCHCVHSNIFTRNSNYSDCDVFVGCNNRGKWTENEGWRYLGDIKCKCDQGYRASNDNGYPACMKQNFFHTENDSEFILPMAMIDPIYRTLFDSPNIYLPNPCKIDALTGKFSSNSGYVKYDELRRIAYCATNNNEYVTVSFEDDYLIGNGGRWSNGVVRVVEKYSPLGDVYEASTRRRRSKLSYGVLAGKRYYADRLTFKLPYLDVDSRNMGGLGISYKGFFNKLEKQTMRFIFIYNASTPEPVKMRIGKVVTYTPLFIAERDSRFKYYLGNMATTSLPLYPINVISIFNKTVPWGRRGYYHFMSEDWPDKAYACGPNEINKFDQFILPLFYIDKSGNKVINENSSIYTGVFLTRVNTDGSFTSPIATSNYLKILYKKQSPISTRKFTENPNRIIIQYVQASGLEHLSDNMKYLMPISAIGYDCSGQAVPNNAQTPIECDDVNNTFKWPERYRGSDTPCTS